MTWENWASFGNEVERLLRQVGTGVWEAVPGCTVDVHSSSNHFFPFRGYARFEVSGGEDQEAIVIAVDAHLLERELQLTADVSMEQSGVILSELGPMTDHLDVTSDHSLSRATDEFLLKLQSYLPLTQQTAVQALCRSASHQVSTSPPAARERLRLS